jgi:hypothetical protein
MDYVLHGTDQIIRADNAYSCRYLQPHRLAVQDLPVKAGDFFTSRVQNRPTVIAVFYALGI